MRLRSFQSPLQTSRRKHVRSLCFSLFVVNVQFQYTRSLNNLRWKINCLKTSEVFLVDKGHQLMYALLVV